MAVLSLPPRGLDAFQYRKILNNSNQSLKAKPVLMIFLLVFFFHSYVQIRQWNIEESQNCIPFLIFCSKIYHLLSMPCSKLLVICKNIFKSIWCPWKKMSSQSISSVAQPGPSLCDPMDCSIPGFPVHHQYLELVQTHVHRVGDTIQPSHPLSSPSPPTFNLSQLQGLF